jgi:seryl-tRNA synthetase
MQELHQLQQENASLEIKIKELTTSHNDLLHLRKDIHKLQQTIDMNNSKLNSLEEENETLRLRLRNVVQSPLPLSDTEKQQMIDDSQPRLHNSAPASISMTLPNVSFETNFILFFKNIIIIMKLLFAISVHTK